MSLASVAVTVTVSAPETTASAPGAVKRTTGGVLSTMNVTTRVDGFCRVS